MEVTDMTRCIETAKSHGHDIHAARGCELYSVACPSCPLIDTDEDRKAHREAVHNKALERMVEAEKTGIQSQFVAAQQAVIKARIAVAYPTRQAALGATNERIRPL